MKIKSLCLSLVCMMFLGSISAYAEPQFKSVEIEYDRSTGIVNISGEVSADVNLAEPVRIMLLKPETDMEKLLSGEKTFMDYGVHADETGIAEYKFEFDEFKLDENLPVGEYKVRIAADAVLYTDTIDVATSTQATELICNATDAAEVEEYIGKYGEVYGLETGKDSIFAGLDDTGKNHVYASVANAETNTLSSVQKEFKVHTLLYKIYAGPWGALEDILKNNATLLGIDISDFTSLSQTDKDEACKALTNNLCKTTAELDTALENAVNTALSNNSTGGGGTGGGGGGKKNSTIGLPAVSAPVTAEPEKQSFTDIDNVLWAKESIELLCEKGIINGRNDEIFAPNDMLTRAEAVKIIVLAFFETDAAAVCDFTDVPKDSWMYPYMAVAAEKGIVKGYADGSAGADNNITREDFAVMIYRAASSAGISLKKVSETAFADEAEISDYAMEAVKALSEAEIINGMGENKFMPKNNTTRAQAAKIVAGFVK